MHTEKRKIWAKVTRWAARILGTGFVLLFGVLLVGEGPPNPFDLTVTEQLGMVAVTVMVGGLILAYWREVYGAALSLAGYVGFTVVDGDFNLDTPFVVVPIAALLYLVAHALDSAKSDDTATKGIRPTG